MPHSYGDSVQVDVILPLAVLRDPAAPEAVRAALDAFEIAQEAVREARAKADAIEDAVADNRAAIARAIAEGKRVPAAVDPAVTEVRNAHAEAEVREARNRAYRLGEELERVVRSPEHRADLRALALAPLADAAQEAAEALQTAEAKYQRVRSLLDGAYGLDVSASASSASLSALVGEHYRKANLADAAYQSGRQMRLSQIWLDLSAIGASLPRVVELAAPDPIEAPDLDKAAGLLDSRRPTPGAIFYNRAIGRYETAK